MVRVIAQVFTTLIDKETLANYLDAPHWVIVDCSYDLTDKNAGRDSYLASHIKGAVFADVLDDLSGPPVTDNGRHPFVEGWQHQHFGPSVPAKKIRF